MRAELSGVRLAAIRLFQRDCYFGVPTEASRRRAEAMTGTNTGAEDWQQESPTRSCLSSGGKVQSRQPRGCPSSC
jgi:hypothetical protein